METAGQPQSSTGAATGATRVLFLFVSPPKITQTPVSFVAIHQRPERPDQIKTTPGHSGASAARLPPVPPTCCPRAPFPTAGHSRDRSSAAAWLRPRGKREGAAVSLRGPRCDRGARATPALTGAAPAAAAAAPR